MNPKIREQMGGCQWPDQEELKSDLLMGAQEYREEWWVVRNC